MWSYIVMWHILSLLTPPRKMAKWSDPFCFPCWKSTIYQTLFQDGSCGNSSFASTALLYKGKCCANIILSNVLALFGCFCAWWLAILMSHKATDAAGCPVASLQICLRAVSLCSYLLFVLLVGCCFCGVFSYCHNKSTACDSAKWIKGLCIWSLTSSGYPKYPWERH